MAVTAVERLRIEKLVVLMFDAAPGAAYLSQVMSLYEATGSDLQRVANALDDVSVFQSLHPAFQTAAEFAADFLAPLGLHDDALAKDFIATRMNTGASKGEIAFEALQALESLAPGAPAQYQAAKAILDHQAAVADYYSAVKAVSQTDFPLLQSVLDGVTADPASVTRALAEIDAGSRGWQGLQVTAGMSVDSITGSNAGDVVHGLFGGAGATWTAGDSIDGAGGNDFVELVATGTAPSAPVIVRNVESIAIVDTLGATFDALLVEGHPAITFSKTQSGQVSRVVNASLDSTIGLAGRGDLAVDYADTSGALDVASIALGGVGSSLAQPSTVDIADGGSVEAFHVDVSGTNYARLVAGPNAGDVTLSGDGTNFLSFASLKNVAVIDASESTGANTFDLGDAFDNGDTVRGGSGDDTVRFHASAALGIVNLQGVETLEADIDANLALNLGTSTGLHTVTLSGGSGSFALSNAGSDLRTVNIESVDEPPAQTIADYNDLEVAYARSQSGQLAVHLGVEGTPGFSLGGLRFVRADSLEIAAASTDQISIYEPLALDPAVQSLTLHAESGALAFFGGARTTSPSALRSLELSAAEDARIVLDPFGDGVDFSGAKDLAVAVRAAASGGVAPTQITAASYGEVNVALGEDASAALRLLGTDSVSGGMGGISLELASDATGSLVSAVNGDIGDIAIAAASGVTWRLDATAGDGGRIGNAVIAIGEEASVTVLAQSQAQADSYGGAGSITVRMDDDSKLDAGWLMQGGVGAVTVDGGEHVRAVLGTYSEHGDLAPASFVFADHAIVGAGSAASEGNIGATTVAVGEDSEVTVRTQARQGDTGAIDVTAGAGSRVNVACDQYGADAVFGGVHVAGGDREAFAQVVVSLKAADSGASIDLHDWMGRYEIWSDSPGGALLIAGPGGGLFNVSGPANTIIGGAGGDTVYAREGDDTIEGGAGVDTLQGGAGHDTFVFDMANLGAKPVAFASAAVTDIVTDFASGADKLAFAQAAFPDTYAENTAPAASLGALLADANAKLDGAVQYYFGVTGGNGYLVYSEDGATTGVVIQLTGLADLAASDIVFLPD